MDDRRNYYRVLHLQPDAPIGLVRVNYRTIMQKLNAHPDLGGENWSAAHINTAYQTLSDPGRREAYDRELLARYDIETIAEGVSKPKARRPIQPVDAGVNRRNYYRVLQCQRDSPIEILEASHGMLRAAQPDEGMLLDEAIALLSDRRLRAAYDRLLNTCDHPEAVERIQQDFAAKRSYQPVITSYCAFCKRPHAGHTDDPEVCCAECNSPLFPPKRGFVEVARRALSRLTRSDPVRLFFDWPSHGVSGQLVDLSPTGMRCETTAHLDLNDVVKVAADAFDAVGSVAHAHHTDGQTEAGMRFLAIRFPRMRGNFRSLKI